MQQTAFELFPVWKSLDEILYKTEIEIEYFRLIAKYMEDLDRRLSELVKKKESNDSDKVQSLYKIRKFVAKFIIPKP